MGKWRMEWTSLPTPFIIVQRLPNFPFRASPCAITVQLDSTIAQVHSDFPKVLYFYHLKIKNSSTPGYDVVCACVYVPESFSVRPNPFSPSWLKSGDDLKVYSQLRKPFETLVKFICLLTYQLTKIEENAVSIRTSNCLKFRSGTNKLRGVIKFILIPKYIDKETSRYLASKALVGVMLWTFCLLCLLLYLPSISIRDLSLNF